MILAFPALAVAILLGSVTVGEVSAYRMSTETVRAVSLSLGVQDLIQQLQTERGVTAGLLGGNVSFREELPAVRGQVDGQRAAVERLTSDGGAVEDRVRVALRDLDGLTAIRAGTDAATIQRATAFQFFTARIAALSGLDYGLEHSTDRDLARGMAVLQALGDLKESTAQERAFLNGVFSAGGFAKGEFLEFSAMRAARQSALDRFERQATARQREANDYVLDTGAARTAAHFEQTALGAFDGRHVVVNPQSWWSALTTVLDDMRRMQAYVGSEIQARAETLQNRATLRLTALFGLVLLCFAGALALLITASRSITQPLAALAAEADGVASLRLPEAVARAQAGGDGKTEPPDPVRVPIRASLEIRSVAGALDRVQSAAYELALEQATLRRRTTDSLANLGRRSQNLLRRQLGFITRLEREESDPSGLANLFELDHLATRMRRNAESLLVLVGAATPRQWTTPLPVADVIRAAVSEVEEYRRVSLRRIDDAYVLGTVVAAVTHILAELIENGLTFSPPDSEVEVQGRRLGGQYLIAITDQGIGMSPEELQAATARLRGETDFVLAPSRYLGHHVVGHLARDLDVDVQLSPSPVTGVTARVTLPESMLTAPAAIQAGPADAAAQVTMELPVTVDPPPSQPRRQPSAQPSVPAGASPSAQAPASGRGAASGQGTASVRPGTVDALAVVEAQAGAAASGDPGVLAGATPFDRTSISERGPAQEKRGRQETEVVPYQRIDTIDYIVTPPLPAGPPVLMAPVGPEPVGMGGPPSGTVGSGPVGTGITPTGAGGPAGAGGSGGPAGSWGSGGPAGSWGSGGPTGAFGSGGSAGALGSGGSTGSGGSAGAAGSANVPSVPAERAGGPPASARSTADGERTRNGLRKRPARARAPRGRPAPPEQRPDVAEVNHAPNEVRARLSSLRAGVRRGEAERQSVSSQWGGTPSSGLDAPDDTANPGRTGR